MTALCLEPRSAACVRSRLLRVGLIGTMLSHPGECDALVKCCFSVGYHR